MGLVVGSTTGIVGGGEGPSGRGADGMLAKPAVGDVAPDPDVKRAGVGTGTEAKVVEDSAAVGVCPTGAVFNELCGQDIGGVTFGKGAVECAKEDVGGADPLAGARNRACDR